MRRLAVAGAVVALAGCGDAPSSSSTTTGSADGMETCGLTPPASPPDTSGVPLALVPQAQVIEVQRAPGQVVARVFIERSVTAAHDAARARAGAAGYTVTGHENEVKEAEVYLTKGAQRVTLRLNRPGRCANAALATVAVSG